MPRQVTPLTSNVEQPFSRGGNVRLRVPQERPLSDNPNFRYGSIADTKQEKRW